MYCPGCHKKLDTSLTSCDRCGWQIALGQCIPRAEHDRIVAEKGAEVARLHAAARDVVRAYQEENFMRHADMHPASCGCLRCEIDRLGNACGHFEKPSFPPAPPSKETAMSEAERDAQIEEGTWR